MLIWVNKINYQGATVHVSPFDAFLVQNAHFRAKYTFGTKCSSMAKCTLSKIYTFSNK